MTLSFQKTDAPFLRLENLSKSYSEGDQQRHVLRNANIAVARGEVVAILGKSGSGKTTILNLISGIDRADEGDVYVAGQRLTGLDERDRTLFRRRHIGFIFQFFNLIPTLSVWENVILPLELNGQDNASGLERANYLLETVGLADRKAAFPDRLSGGEQQRIAIARALVHQPELVLADEPTGNLDEDTGRQVLALLDQLTRQAGQSMVLVTHSSEAASIADRVFALREGHLVEKDAGKPGQREAGKPGQREAGKSSQREAGTPGQREGDSSGPEDWRVHEPAAVKGSEQ
jgi:putative ABC transport system ATP-binding protein